jgi:hypothetical protein
LGVIRLGGLPFLKKTASKKKLNQIDRDVF